MKWIQVLLAASALVVSTSALAQVPRTMSYQGLLTDNSGAPLPDGSYDITFRIYSVPSAGSALYTEAHTGPNGVPLSKGGFSVILGSLTPMTLPFDGPYYLGIQVASDPEITPRVSLAASPYSLGLILPFSCSTTAGNTLLTGYDFFVGGALSGFTFLGGRSFDLQPDISGQGGFFQVHGGNTGGFLVDGNSGGDARIVMTGGGSTTLFNTNFSGDSAVSLPASSVSALEIFNEPGIAQGRAVGQVEVTGTATMADIVTTTITIPASGYVVLQFHAQAGLSGVAGPNVIIGQIDETLGGAEDPTHSAWVGSEAFPSTAANYFPYSATRTYFKPAGTHAFRMEALRSDVAGTGYFNNPTLTATYLPTSYGGVVTSPNAAEVAEFSIVERGSKAGIGRQRGSEGKLVDLRELELRVSRAREAAVAAEKSLIEAQLEEQSHGPRNGSSAH